MAEADWHLKDLLSFYVSKCRSELVNVSEDPVRAETMHEAVKRVREVMILMSCMVGAFTPSEISALHRLDQIRLVAENEAAQMLRVGEDMALLRLWLKSAGDSHWNVTDAIKLLRTGKLSSASSFPEMTTDLLTSVKKPYVVSSTLPSNSASIRRILQTSITSQFSRAKLEPPFVPDRIKLEFSEEDDSVCLSAAGEFYIKGIFDHRRWTIIEAQILDDVAGRRQCRQILQAISNSSIAEMCCAALRMSTAQKLKLFQDEAVEVASHPGWCSIYSVSKAQAGLGNGFTVGLFRKLTEFSFTVNFAMDFDNGDFVVTVNGHESIVMVDYYEKGFMEIIQDVEAQVRALVFNQYLGSALSGHHPSRTVFAHMLLLADDGVAIVLNPSGTATIRMGAVSDESISCSINSVDIPKFNQYIELAVFASRTWKAIATKTAEGWTQCALPPDASGGVVELTLSFDEFFAHARTAMDSQVTFACAFRTGKRIEIVTFVMHS